MDISTFASAAFHLPYTDRVLMGVSPDSKWVAWTWYGLNECADVFVAPTDGSSPPRVMTDGKENSVFAAWTLDSRAVLVEQDHDGDERYRVYRVDLEAPREMKLLTDAAPKYFLRGGELHPNGRWLVYGANYDFARDTLLEPTWLWRHDLVTGERVALACPNKTATFAPALAATGEHVLYLRAEKNPAGRHTWVVGIDGTGDHEIYDPGADKRCHAAWFPDGKRLVLLVETATHMRVGVCELGSGAVRWLIDNAARNIEDAYVPFGSEKIVVIEAQEGGYKSSLLDPETGVEEHLQPVAGNLVLVAPVGEREWVAHYAISDAPDDLVRVNLDELDPNKFLSLARVWERTLFTREDFVAAEDLRWRSVDGLEIQGWLYRAKEPRGTIVYVHGGPTGHHEDRMNPEIQYYVRAGFNVLDPNYRGSTGFGLAFRNAIRVQGWGGLEQDDIRTGIETLIAAGIAERGKVGITGTSYGGYSAWYAITHFPTDLIAAAAPICGMTDLVIDYETTRPDLRPYSEEMMGGTPSQVPERYYERSPIHYVQNIRGELLIVQGMQDPNVTPENVRAVTVKLQEAGVEYQTLVFEDEGHGIYKPRNLKLLCTRLADFFGAAFSN